MADDPGDRGDRHFLLRGMLPRPVPFRYRFLDAGFLVRRSILFYNARVGEGSVVEDSVVLPGAQIGRDVRLKRAIGEL